MFSIFICVWYVSIIHSFLGSNNIPSYEKQIYAPNYLKTSSPFFSLILWNVHRCPSFPITDLQIWENSSRKPNLCPKKNINTFPAFSHNSGYPQPLEKIAKKPVAQGLQAIIRQNGIPGVVWTEMKWPSAAAWCLQGAPFPSPCPVPGLWGGLSGSLEQWNKETSEKLQEPVWPRLLL